MRVKIVQQGRLRILPRPKNTSHLPDSQSTAKSRKVRLAPPAAQGLIPRLSPGEECPNDAPVRTWPTGGEKASAVAKSPDAPEQPQRLARQCATLRAAASGVQL